MFNRVKKLLTTKPHLAIFGGAAADRTDRVTISGKTNHYENLSSIANYTAEAPWINFENVKMERRLEDYVAEDKYPLPSTADREGYHGARHYDYWLSGLKDYLCIKQTLERQGTQLSEASKVFDFGCASGRVLRHFACHENNLELWGADINQRHIDWIRRFLHPSLKIFQNTTLPHLPLEDNQLSLIYSLSVFTHIDQFELAWLAELRRVLQTGGLAYLSIHSERTWEQLGPNQAIYHDLLGSRGHVSDYDVTPEFLKGPMPSERTVFTWKFSSINNATLFHSTDYIKNVWGRFFQVVQIIHKGHDYQDVVLLRKIA